MTIKNNEEKELLYECLYICIEFNLKWKFYIENIIDAYEKKQFNLDFRDKLTNTMISIRAHGDLAENAQHSLIVKNLKKIYINRVKE